MKVKEFLEPFAEDQIFIVDGNYFTRKGLMSSYSDYEVFKVKSYEDGLWLKLDISICDCYEVTKERHYLTEYEKGYYYGKRGERLDYITKEVPRCRGTKEKDVCSCGGYKSRCDFYNENELE